VRLADFHLIINESFKYIRINNLFVQGRRMCNTELSLGYVTPKETSCTLYTQILWIFSKVAKEMSSCVYGLFAIYFYILS